MKRFIALFLSVLVVLSFASCSADKPKLSAAEISAAEGKLDGVKYPLGTNPDTIIEYYEDYIEQNGEESNYLFVDEGTETTSIMTLSDLYYYENDKMDSGVAVAVSFANVFGYEVGITLMEDIKADLGGEFTTFTATEEQMYFFPSYEENCEVLSVMCGDFKLEFFFINGFLSVTSLTNTTLWG